MYGFGGQSNRVSQVLTLDTTASYTVNYAYNIPDVFLFGDSCVLRVLYGSQVLDSTTLSTLTAWTPKSATFTVQSSSSASLIFEQNYSNLGPGGEIDLALDNVSLSVTRQGNSPSCIIP